MAQRAAPSACARILATNKPAFAMEAPVGQPEVKRRRLRTKTTVAQVAVALVAAAASVQAVAQVQWAQRFLEDEDLSAEEDAARKAVYLVTLPHPGQAAQGTQGLRAPDSLTREQVVQMILDAVAHPAYQDPAAQSRHGPSIRVEQMVVYRELHAPDEQGIAHAHFHIADPSQNPANKPGLSGTPSDGGHPSAKLITVILRFCLSPLVTPGSMLPAVDKMFFLSGPVLFAQH